MSQKRTLSPGSPTVREATRFLRLLSSGCVKKMVKFISISLKSLCDFTKRHDCWTMTTREVLNRYIKPQSQEKVDKAEEWWLVDREPQDRQYVYVVHSRDACWGMAVTMCMELLESNDCLFFDPLCQNHVGDWSLEGVNPFLEDVFKNASAMLVCSSIGDDLAQKSDGDLHELYQRFQRADDYNDFLDSDTIKLTLFLRLWPLREIHEAAVRTIPIVILFGQEPICGGDGQWMFLREDSTFAVNTVGDIVRLELASTSCSQEEMKILMDPMLKHRGTEQAEDAKKDVELMIRAAVRGAIVAGQWPEVQAMACGKRVQNAKRLACSADRRNGNPLQAAAAAGYSKVMSDLLDEGAAVSEEVLFAAASSHNPEALQMLIDYVPAQGATEHYDVYLSMKFTDNQLSQTLEAHLNLKGYSCFRNLLRDPDEFETSSFQKCRSFIFIHHDGTGEDSGGGQGDEYLEDAVSTFSREELMAAVRQRKNIIVIEGNVKAPYDPSAALRLGSESSQPAPFEKVYYTGQYHNSFLQRVLDHLPAPKATTWRQTLLSKEEEERSIKMLKDRYARRATTQGDAKETRYFSEIRSLVCGDFEQAVMGLVQRLGVDENHLAEQKMKGTHAIIEEIRSFGNESVQDDLDYVVNQEASEKEYPNGIRDKDRGGKKLADFMKEREVKECGLTEPEVRMSCGRLTCTWYALRTLKCTWCLVLAAGGGAASLHSSLLHSHQQTAAGKRESETTPITSHDILPGQGAEKAAAQGCSYRGCHAGNHSLEGNAQPSDVRVVHAARRHRAGAHVHNHRAFSRPGICRQQ